MKTFQQLASRLFLGALLLAARGAHAQFTYATNNDSITITGYTGSGGAVTIANVIDGLPVTDIGTNAFEGSVLTSVTVPDSVTNIGDYAFYGCFNLTNVTFGSNVVSIGNYAFSGPPGSVTTDGMVSFGDAPQGCPLTSITIPNSVISLGDSAFYGCASLTNVTLGNGLTSLGNYAFSGNRLTSITIPNSVISLGDFAFYGCPSLTNVALGNGLTSLGDSFAGTSLISITIPGSVTNIGIGALEGCANLTAINVAPGNPAYTSVAGVLFNRTETTLLEYPGGVGGSYAIPTSVLTIGAAAFAQCQSLTNVTLSLGLVDIGSNAFNGCRFTSITIPATVTTIGVYAFNNCGWLINANFLGNAPDADSTVFSFSNGVLPQWAGVGRTAYYLPGTTGWAAFATNTAVPTALWTLPYPLVLNGSSGVLNNQFGFTISWATNVPVVVEASADLSNPVWTPVATNTLSNGTSSFTDPDWTNYPNRFYRLPAQ